jgi:hypothetical protein
MTSGYLEPWIPLLLAGALLAGLCGCKVHKQGEGANKEVDIETPVGSFHVNTQVDPKDTGLAVYPGATRAENEEHKHAANLTMDSSLFGLKVVAVKFHSDDPPDKLLDFYRKQLKAYGEVSECHGSVGFDRSRDLGTNNAGLQAYTNVRCHETGLGDETNLVTGTAERHHIVSVKPEGKGSAFALVYVQMRGEKGTL